MSSAVPGDPTLDERGRELVKTIRMATLPGFLRNLDHKTLRDLARAAGNLETEARYYEPIRQNQATTLPGGRKVKRT